MPHSSSPSSDTDDKDYAQELRDFIAELYERPDREAVASEIEGEVKPQDTAACDEALNLDTR